MPKTKYSTHLGMVDILPGEVEKWRALEEIIHEEAARYNFEEIRTPIMEQTELIKRGVGQLTDIVTKEIFAFTKGDSHYVLRPELTAPVVRAFVQHHLAQRGGAQKLYYRTNVSGRTATERSSATISPIWIGSNWQRRSNR